MTALFLEFLVTSCTGDCSKRLISSIGLVRKGYKMMETVNKFIIEN